MKYYKVTKILTIGLIISLLLSINIATFAKEKKYNNTYTITSPYDYPIQPGTKKWKSLRTHAEKLKVCQIPKDILNNMTTDALIDTVLNYPLLIDMLSMQTKNIGYQALYKNFNGMQELETRLDRVVELNKYKLDLIKKNKNNKRKDESENLRLEYLEIIIDNCKK